jgi:hypothetical protein
MPPEGFRMRRILLSLAATAILAAADAPAPPPLVELSLSNGRTVRGELVAEADGQLTIRSRFPVRGDERAVTTNYLVGDVLKRKELPPIAKQYDELKAATPETVPELSRLAQWCYENCLRAQAKEHAEQVLRLDPGSAWARNILDKCGYVEANGAWVDEAAYMKDNSLARLDGKLVPQAVADGRKALAKALTVRDNLVRQITELAPAEKEAPKRIADAEAQVKDLPAKIEQARKDAAAAEEEMNAQNRLVAIPANQRPAGTADPQRALAAATRKRDDANKRREDAEKQLSEAKRRLAVDRTALDRSRRDLPDLRDSLVRQIAEVERICATLPADDPVAAEARASQPNPDGTPAKPPAKQPGKAPVPAPPPKK